MHSHIQQIGSPFRRLAALAVALTALTGSGAVVALEAPANAASLVYQVTNYDNDGTHGVYLRNSSNVNDVDRDASHYVTYGTSVQLICAEWGSSVGPLVNTAWDYVEVLTGSNAGTYGHLSEHWLNTPVSSNQHVAGEPACGASTPTPTPTPTPTAPSSPTISAKAQTAIQWATAQLGSTGWNGACLSFVRSAYAAANVNLRTEVGVGWGSNTYPQNIWGHFTAGTTGTGTPPAGALVFYLAKPGRSQIYSHVTLAVDGSGDTISTNDSVSGGRSSVHRETIAQHSASGAYNTYVGWWLP